MMIPEYLTKEQIRYRQDAPFLTFDELSKIDQPGNQFNLRVRIVDILPADLRHILCLICQQCGERSIVDNERTLLDLMFDLGYTHRAYVPSARTRGASKLTSCCVFWL